jgi:hypothetical protein
MDGTVTVCATVQQRHSGPVVVSGMTLQAERGLTDQQQASLHGSVRGVALCAALNDRSVLVGEGSLEFGVALEAQLVKIGVAQIVGSRAAVRIVAIRATHLGFADGMVIRQAAFCLLLVVASDAGINSLAPGSQLGLGGVHLVAINAAHIVRLMCARRPVLQLFMSGVAPKADSVRLFGFQLTEFDDASVRVAGDVLAPRAVAVFTLQTLLGMVATAESLGRSFMACAALIRAQPLRTGNLHVFRELLLAIPVWVAV